MNRNLRPRATVARSAAHSVAKDMLLRINMGLFPSLDELRAVIEDAIERETYLAPDDVEAERRNWESEAEDAAEEAKRVLDEEIDEHNDTRADLRNAEKDLSDLQKKYDALLEHLDDARQAGQFP